MPITIKTGTLKYKKSDGTYNGFNAIAQEATDQQLADIQAAGTAQVGAVTAKGEEVLESIPEDYTELSGEVGELKSALDEIDNGITQTVETITPELTANKAINYSTGAETTGLAATFAVTDFIPVANAIKIVNQFFGYGVYGFAFYDAGKSFIPDSGNKNVLTITSIPANAKYIRFTDYVASGEHVGKQVTTTIVYKTAAAVDKMIKSDLDGFNRKIAHFSFDDCVFWDDLTQNANTYNSAFDNSFLATLKNLHDTYGLKFTLLCFIVSEGRSIADVTDKFAAEFKANKDWLRFGFHGTTPSETFSTADPETVLGYYNTFVTAIYKMTGDYDCIDRVTRLSSFGGSKAVCLALRNANMGLRGFLCNDGTGGSYFLNSDTNNYVNTSCKYYDAETQLTFIHSMSRLEGSVTTVENLQTIVQQNHLPIFEFFSHQDQFTTGVITKTQQIADWLNSNGFTHGFPQYALVL